MEVSGSVSKHFDSFLFPWTAVNLLRNFLAIYILRCGLKCFRTIWKFYSSFIQLPSECRQWIYINSVINFTRSGKPLIVRDRRSSSRLIVESESVIVEKWFLRGKVRQVSNDGILQGPTKRQEVRAALFFGPTLSLAANTYRVTPDTFFGRSVPNGKRVRERTRVHVHACSDLRFYKHRERQWCPNVHFSKQLIALERFDRAE